jgi:hypothetical protein
MRRFDGLVPCCKQSSLDANEQCLCLVKWAVPRRDAWRHLGVCHFWSAACCEPKPLNPAILLSPAISLGTVSRFGAKIAMMVGRLTERVAALQNQFSF